ncbi:MAG: sigma-70 family RNA polymerase sigma factor [Anaerolineaceae bacterium]|nr:sigma-70 family RNA polymerase sigma factor [Anaerolineaceae bacterium]
MNTTIDEKTFEALSEPYRRELQVHCYRMMGSVQDAEDMVQETYLRAWRRRDTYEGRASFRAWLYKIATNACLDALEKRKRRVVPFTHGDAATLDQPIPADFNEPIWLEPIPDEWLAVSDIGPESYYAARENITLAFMTVLHLLPPRQRAVLILRDVLEWEAAEAADLLGTTVASVKSALHRARETLSANKRPHLEGTAPQTLDDQRQSMLESYVRAWQTADIKSLLALLHEDATFSMPPIPAWYQGRATIGGLVGKTIFAGQASGRWRLIPTRANGQIAFGLYRRDDAQAVYIPYAIQLLTFADDGQIADIITFRSPSLITTFKLPATLPI